MHFSYSYQSMIWLVIASKVYGNMQLYNIQKYGISIYKWKALDHVIRLGYITLIIHANLHGTFLTFQAQFRVYKIHDKKFETVKKFVKALS